MPDDNAWASTAGLFDEEGDEESAEATQEVRREGWGRGEFGRKSGLVPQLSSSSLLFCRLLNSCMHIENKLKYSRLIPIFQQKFLEFNKQKETLYCRCICTGLASTVGKIFINTNKKARIVDLEQCKLL